MLVNNANRRHGLRKELHPASSYSLIGSCKGREVLHVSTASAVHCAGGIPFLRTGRLDHYTHGNADPADRPRGAGAEARPAVPAAARPERDEPGEPDPELFEVLHGSGLLGRPGDPRPLG